MSGKGWGRAGGILAAAALCLACMSPLGQTLGEEPREIRLRPGDETQICFSLPCEAEVRQAGRALSVERGGAALTLTAGEEAGSAEVTYRLLGIIPVKTVTVTVEPERRVVPGGHSVGVALSTRGVVVVGNSDVAGSPSPGRMAGLRSGDLIVSAGGEDVLSARRLTELVQGGGALRLEVERDGERSSVDVTPVFDRDGGAWRLGVWVRDSAAGMGTLTYFDPDTNRYGALGHAVTDVDTNLVLPIGDGAIYKGAVLDIRKGASGSPGELIGSFPEDMEREGSLERNTDFGIFGAMDAPVVNPLYPEGIPVATRSEVRTGEAQILTTLDDGELRTYDCEITRLYGQDAPSTRSMVVSVTDPELKAATGGIVQGMSGSPIVQDGRLVGAVTHVFVNDPTQGYGVYIDWMMEADR